MSIDRAGGHLCLFTGNSLDVLTKITRETGADTVVWNRRYEPAAIESDSALKKKLGEAGLTVKSFAGNVCHEPWQVQRTSNHPYKVFTAYWRASLKIESLPLTKAVKKLTNCLRGVSDEVGLQDLALLPSTEWAKAFPEHWQPGESGAHKALKLLLSSKLDGYQTNRDIPSVDGTSILSPHLAFGEISPRTINASVRDA